MGRKGKEKRRQLGQDMGGRIQAPHLFRRQSFGKKSWSEAEQRVGRTRRNGEDSEPQLICLQERETEWMAVHEMLLMH